MTQVLTLKKKDGPGLDEVRVIRSWQDVSGAQIYLHTTGVYGYKDGSPVMNKKAFDIIGDPIQKKLALKWWKQKGEQMAKDFYEAREKEMEQRQMAEIPVVEGDVSDLDAAMYRRRKGKGKWSDAGTWFNWFKQRPDWWGYAERIVIAGHEYEQVDVGDEDEIQAADEAEAANFA